MSKKITISVLNRSDKTIVSDADLDDFVHNALQPQVSDDFFPFWNVDAEVLFVDQPVPNSWWLVILDRTDQNGWLGYHLTQDGMPLGRVFAQTIKDNGGNWNVSASHELLEMLADPWDNRMISDRPFDPAHLPKVGDKGATFYALEVCDPCSTDACAYDKDRFKVSDFILPSWYDSGTPAGQFVDYNQKIQGPFTLADGGYTGAYSDATGWELIVRSSLPAFRLTLIDAGLTWMRTHPRVDWTPVAAGDI